MYTFYIYYLTRLKYTCYMNSLLSQQFQLYNTTSDLELDSVKSSWESERENSFTVMRDHPLTSSVTLSDSLPTTANHTGEINSIVPNAYIDRFKREIKNGDILMRCTLICPPLLMFSKVQKCLILYLYVEFLVFRLIDVSLKKAVYTGLRCIFMQLWLFFPWRARCYFWHPTINNSIGN